jgi:hypothetical protein
MEGRAYPGRECGVQDRPHHGPACASHGCRLMPVSSACGQTVHPDPANELPTDDQEGPTTIGDQAPDLDFLVAGAGFEPATSGL